MRLCDCGRCTYCRLVRTNGVLPDNVDGPGNVLEQVNHLPSYRKCVIAGCQRVRLARMMCSTHYRAWMDEQRRLEQKAIKRALSRPAAAVRH